MIGWELDGPALGALGDATGARCPECACPLDERAEDGGHAIDCLVVNRGGARAGAGRTPGKRKLETTPHRLRLPKDVIEAAQQRALDLSADMCRHVSRQEVYRGLVAGELAPLATDGAGPWKSETLWLTPEQSARLHACAEKQSLSLPNAADFLCRNAGF
jgi:hypothetical protein